MKTKTLFKTSLTKAQQKNSEFNLHEYEEGKTTLKSYPRRIVLELTNACNYRCIMCGRDIAEFKAYFLPFSVIKMLKPYFSYAEEVTLHGWGEGTLHPDFIDILQFFDSFKLLRKYFVTNGSKLDKIQDAIFDCHVDIIAISLDGATAETNNAIRVNADFNQVIKSLNDLVAEKERRNADYPYMNFVFTAMHKNIHELPGLVTLAHKMKIPEVKVVYLTIFSEELRNESLIDKQDLVREIFNEASCRAKNLGIKLKLPEIQGEGIGGDLRHLPCALAWRDLFVGSDSFIRPCQSSSKKLGKVSANVNIDSLWNSKDFQDFRNSVNNKKLMPKNCYYCYHSSSANWELSHTFLQLEKDFAPEWDGRAASTGK